MPYIPFTDEQKRMSNSIDLAEFLRSQGEQLIRSGPELRMKSDHSVTIRGNKWYDHATRQGGGPVEFLQTHLGMNYQEAMETLLAGCGGIPFPEVKHCTVEPEKEFTLPKANKDMRRALAYLTKFRGIDPKVVSAFARKRLIYEEASHHNAVFVGLDGEGIPRHAHSRSTQSTGGIFRINESGSKPQYSFHWLGQNNTLYIFEAPIDLLSYVSLYPEDWESSSYVALCGVSEKPILWMLEQYPNLRQVTLCLDNDRAGIEATRRITNLLSEKGYDDVMANFSIEKDWNEDLKAARGLVQSESINGRKLNEDALQSAAKDASPEKGRLAQMKIPAILGQRNRYLQLGLIDKASGCLKAAASYAISAAKREYHQTGKELREKDVVACIKAAYGSMGDDSRLANCLLDIQKQTKGIHTSKEKLGTASAWLDFAAKCLYAVESTQSLQKAANQESSMTMGGIC